MANLGEEIQHWQIEEPAMVPVEPETETLPQPETVPAEPKPEEVEV